MADANPYNPVQTLLVDSKDSYQRVTYVKLALVNTASVLVGTYILIATIYVMNQLAEPGAVNVPRFWYKSLVRFPLQSVYRYSLILIPTMVAIVFAFRAIGSRESVNLRSIIIFGLTSWVTFCLTKAVVLFFAYDSTPRRDDLFFGLLMPLIYFGLGTGICLLFFRNRSSIS